MKNKETNEIGWVVQSNLTSDRYVYVNLVDIFLKHNIPFEFVKVIPFSEELPKFNHERINVFYGSTTFINNLYKTNQEYILNGVFFNPETFKMDLYLKHWGDLMLNSGGEMTSFKKLLEEDKYADDRLLFIRPNDDSKLFSGQVKSFSEIKNWQKNIGAIKDDLLTEDTAILVAEPYKINKEWRNIIINGKVISSSRYYKDGLLSKSADDIPKEVIDLCHKACEIFTPHDIFAMDIAETGGEYYILECGCFNSVGFYDLDMEEVILKVNNYIQNNISSKNHQCKFCGEGFLLTDDLYAHQEFDCPSLKV